MLIVVSDVGGQDCAGCDVDDVSVTLCAQTALECIVSGVSCGVLCAYTLDYPPELCHFFNDGNANLSKFAYRFSIITYR